MMRRGCGCEYECERRVCVGITIIALAFRSTSGVISLRCGANTSTDNIGTAIQPITHVANSKAHTNTAGDKSSQRAPALGCGKRPSTLSLRLLENPASLSSAYQSPTHSASGDELFAPSEPEPE
jgi:hypothetical protein